MGKKNASRYPPGQSHIGGAQWVLCAGAGGEGLEAPAAWGYATVVVKVLLTPYSASVGSTSIWQCCILEVHCRQPMVFGFTHNGLFGNKPLLLT